MKLMEENMKLKFLAGVAIWSFASVAQAACPAVTVADSMGVPEGKYRQQYELSEFQETTLACGGYAR